MGSFAAAEQALREFHGQDNTQHNGDGHFYGEVR